MVVFSKCVWQMIAISSLRLSFVITGICQTYPINCLLKIYCPIFNSFKYWLQPGPSFWFLEEHLHLILSKLNWSCFRHLSSLSFILQLLELRCIWSFYTSINSLCVQWLTSIELTCGYTECFLALWKNGEIIAKILSRGHEITAFFATRKTKWPVNHPPPNIPYIRFIFRSGLDSLVYRAI